MKIVISKSKLPKVSAKVNELLQKLYEANLANYTKRGEQYPEAAAKYAVTDLYNRYKNDVYIEQVLQEELEDTINAGHSIKHYKDTSRSR